MRLIIVIGFSTLFLRAIFLYIEPLNFTDPVFRKAMEAVPTALLVGLVIPFLIFTEGWLNLISIEMLASLLTIPFVYWSKRPWIGILVAFAFYYALQIFL